jgi:hypothetical protein
LEHKLQHVLHDRHPELEKSSPLINQVGPGDVELFEAFLEVGGCSRMAPSISGTYDTTNVFFV